MEIYTIDNTLKEYEEDKIELIDNIKISVELKEKIHKVAKTMNQISYTSTRDAEESILSLFNTKPKMQISDKTKESLMRIGFTKQDFEIIFTEEDLLNKMAEKWSEGCKEKRDMSKTKKAWQKNKFWER